jgi:hypothetical protein
LTSVHEPDVPSVHALTPITQHCDPVHDSFVSVHDPDVPFVQIVRLPQSVSHEQLVSQPLVVLHEHEPAQSESQLQPVSQLLDVSQLQLVEQSGSHEHELLQVLDVSHAQLAAQSGSHEQLLSQLELESHAQPPMTSQRWSTGSHSSPWSQPPPTVHAHPSAPTAHVPWSSP